MFIQGLKQMDKKTNKETNIEFTNLEMFMSPRMINGSPAIEIRKIITFCEQNVPALEKIIEIGLSEQEVELVTKVSLKFNDKFKALTQLQQLGLDTAKFQEKLKEKA